MKVKITKCSSPLYWYSNKIGETFEVKISPFNQFKYTLTFNNIQHYIEEKDCEIIPEVDYTIPGTPLPDIPKGTVYMTLSGLEYDDVPKFSYSKKSFISYGKIIIEDEVWIKCETPSYNMKNYFIIKLETIKQLANTNTNTMEKMHQITPNQAKNIIEIACSGWRKKLAEKWAVKIMLDETIEVSDEFVKEMFSASNETQIKLLNTIFKSNEIDLNNPKTINNLSLFRLDGDISNSLMAIRSNGKYENKAFFLNEQFDWKLDRDEKGALCLIPTKHQ